MLLGVLYPSKAAWSCLPPIPAGNSCPCWVCNLLVPILGAQIPKTSQLFLNSQGFWATPPRGDCRENLLSHKGSGTAPRMWSHRVTSCKNHHVGKRSLNTRMPLGFFSSHFPRAGLRFPCWWSLHWIIWGHFPHQYQIFHPTSALSCSRINPSPTASLGSNVRAPKFISGKIFFFLFQEKSALCQAHPPPPARCNIWGTALLKAAFLGQNTQSVGYFGFFLWGQLGTGNRIFKKPSPNVHMDVMDPMWSKEHKENRGKSSEGEQRM